MEFWNAQSLFMKFFPLVSSDEKPKGIFVIFCDFSQKYNTGIGAFDS